MHRGSSHRLPSLFLPEDAVFFEGEIVVGLDLFKQLFFLAWGDDSGTSGASQWR
jgi:hypothetical protein